MAAAARAALPRPHLALPSSARRIPSVSLAASPVPGPRAAAPVAAAAAAGAGGSGAVHGAVASTLAQVAVTAVAIASGACLSTKVDFLWPRIEQLPGNNVLCAFVSISCSLVN